MRSKAISKGLCVALQVFSACLFSVAVLFAQKDPAPAAKTESAPASAQPPGKLVKGLDPETGIPLYKTIVEDWGSLQIGNSHLAPIDPVVTPVDEQETFTRQLVQVKWRPGDAIELWIIRPKGITRPPAVLYLYNATEDTARFRNDGWCERVTYGGVAAIGFVSALTGQRFHDRPMKQWFVSELQESLGSTVHDVKFILDYMEKRGDFDMNHVGMFGEGSGGAIAILAAAADSRIKAVDAIDPWGDWPEFLAKSPVVMEDPDHANFVRPEFLQKVAGLDPVKWLPQLKIPVRIIQVRDNEATPMEVKAAITAAAPAQTDIVRYATALDMGQRVSMGKLFGWIKEKVQPPPKTDSPSGTKAAVEERAISTSAQAEQAMSHE